MGYGIAQREWADWLLAGLIVSALLAGAWAMLGGFEKAEKVDNEGAVTLTPEGELAPVSEANIAPPLEIVARTSEPASVVSIYECVENGQKVLADRPCGPNATVRMIDTRALNTFTEVPVANSREHGPSSVASTPAGATVEMDVGASDPAKKQLCQSLQDRIDYINARTRQRHTHREGEYWRAEWHKAKRAYSDAQCGR